MSAPLASGTVLAERFRIVRLLGEGSTGRVYEIVNEATRQRAAIKVLDARSTSRGSDGGGVDRFLGDAAAAGGLGNAHIVSTSDTGRLPSGEAYVVMELLDGITLTQRIAETGGLALPELAAVMSQACDGLQAAHDKGIVHACLSPSSVFITSGGGRPLVKILDFGDHNLDAARARTTYRSPEQIASAPAVGTPDAALDALTDVYALGVILHEAAGGARASGGAPLGGLRPELPPELGALCARATASDRAERTASARDLGYAIGALSPSAAIDPLGQTLPVSGPPAVAGALAAAIAAAEASRAAARAAETPAGAPPVSAHRSAPPSIRPAPALVSRRSKTILAIVAGALAALLVALVASRLRSGDPEPPPGPGAPTARPRP